MIVYFSIWDLGKHEDDRMVLYKTKSLDGTKANTNPKTNLNPNTKLTLILTLFSFLCFFEHHPMIFYLAEICVRIRFYAF